MLRMTAGGSTKYLDMFLNAIIRGDYVPVEIEMLCARGIEALNLATPHESGETGNSWYYEIVKMGDNFTIWFSNDHVIGDFNVAVGLQYGHGTGTGGWVQGRDYINPALRPIFDDISNAVWEEVQAK